MRFKYNENAQIELHSGKVVKGIVTDATGNGSRVEIDKILYLCVRLTRCFGAPMVWKKVLKI